MDAPLQILRPFLGRRILKTGLAVFIVIAAFHWIGSTYATFAAVAAIMAMGPSPAGARDLLREQLLGNLIAGVVGATLGYWLGPTAPGMALATVLVLGICARFGLNETAGLAVTVVLFIMDRPEQDFLPYLLVRLAVIATGMLVGYAVNRYLFPPDYSGRLKEELSAAAGEVERLARETAASLADPGRLRKQDIKEVTRAIYRRLEACRYYLDLMTASDPYNMRGLLLERLRNSLFVWTERVTDIHKIALRAGGLRQEGALAGAIGAFDAVLRYGGEAMAAALGDGEIAPGTPKACSHALRELEALVDRLVAAEQSRAEGLVLHGVLTNLQHMAWRLDSLVRLLIRSAQP